MTQVIPLNSDGSRRVSVDLGDGIGVITFRSRYNSTVPGWYVDLYDADGNSIVFGLGLVAPHNIIRHLPRLVARIGDLRVIDIDGKGNINPDRLGVGVGLMHYARLCGYIHPVGKMTSAYSSVLNEPLVAHRTEPT